MQPERISKAEGLKNKQLIFYNIQPPQELKNYLVFQGTSKQKKVSNVVQTTKLLVSNPPHLLKPVVSLKETTGFIE